MQMLSYVSQSWKNRDETFICYDVSEGLGAGGVAVHMSICF